MINIEYDPQFQKIPSSNMEPVVYRKEIPPAYQADFDVLDRVASESTPTVKNEQAYNAIYSSHKDWYDEKKYKVIDENFNTMENRLLNIFQETLDEGLDKNYARNIRHADKFDIDRLDVKNIDFRDIPRVNPNLFKGENYNHYDTKVTTSDPYNEIFGDNRLS